MLQHLWLNARRKHKDQIDLIPYNDCFYRNMYRYEYIGLLDIDEGETALAGFHKLLSYFRDQP